MDSADNVASARPPRPALDNVQVETSDDFQSRNLPQADDFVSLRPLSNSTEVWRERLRYPLHSPLPSEFHWQLDSHIDREDHVVRRNVRDMIAEVLSHDGEPTNVLEVLELCRRQCQEAGVPFAPLLEEHLDTFGAPPLVVEILRCQWTDDDTVPPVLSYLLQHSSDKTIAMNIRHAAFLRGDNDIFQRLRLNIVPEFLPPGAMPIFEAEVLEDTEQNSFMMQFEIDDLKDGLQNVRSRLEFRSDEKTPVQPNGVIEFVAAARSWELFIGENSLALKLARGEPAAVDARCVALALDPHELLFPPAVLYPLNASGQHIVILKPCFVGSDPSNFTEIASLDSGELIIQLHVQLTALPGPSVPSELPDGEWETVVRQKDTPASAPEGGGWVKASWSGRDEDL